MIVVKKLFSFFKKRKPVTEQLVATGTVEDELGTLMAMLIQNTLDGPDGIDKLYRNRISQYNAHSNPISQEQAERLLLDMLEKAALLRQQFNANIQRSISDGTLYDRYFNKVALVNDLTNDTYTKLKRMQRVQERFEYKKKLYNNVTSGMYLKHAVRVQQETSNEHPTEDVGDAIDKAGGEIDGEIS